MIMAKTVVGVFRESSAANNAVRDLTSSGVAQSHIRLIQNESEIESIDEQPAQASQPAEESKGLRARLQDKIKGKISGVLESLFDVESDLVHAETYAEAVRYGHFLVIADVESAQVDEVVAIMNRYGTVDLTQESWKSPQVGASEKTTPIASQREATENVVEEELAVGKRVVQRGGVRVHSYVEERPVEEVLRLREERLNVERRPADRILEQPDAAFTERSVELTAEGEEAVVEKRARVVEEVVVNKEQEQREQTIRDSVRRKDVEVEAAPAAKPAKPAAQAQRSPEPPRR
jgi:stress response protein YsnF